MAFKTKTHDNHLNIGQARYSDPHCNFFVTWKSEGSLPASLFMYWYDAKLWSPFSSPWGSWRSMCLNTYLSSCNKTKTRVVIVKIQNLFIILLCTNLYHFFLISILDLQCIHCLLQLYVTRYRRAVHPCVIATFARIACANFYLQWQSNGSLGKSPFSFPHLTKHQNDASY